MKRRSVAVILGTRPEAIKLAPVILALRQSKLLHPVVVNTAQHRHLTKPVLDRFRIKADHDLRVMRQDQSLSDLSGRLLQSLGRHFAKHTYAAVLVQGDTTSALLGGLSAFYHRLPLGHVEAGLRTGDPSAPFPEETNRALLSRLATWHFAPTADAARNLRREGIAKTDIHVTGNPIVDALRWIQAHPLKSSRKPSWATLQAGQKLVLITCHRRETQGDAMRRIAQAIAQLARMHHDAIFLWPVHPNPKVRRLVTPILRKLSNVRLTGPLPYDDFLQAMQAAHLILSDSGGVQEEATALGKRVLVMRDKTERPEGLRAGLLKLVGTNPTKILLASRIWLRRHAAPSIKAGAKHIYGDGQAASQIVRALEEAL